MHDVIAAISQMVHIFRRQDLPAPLTISAEPEVMRRLALNTEAHTTVNLDREGTYVHGVKIRVGVGPSKAAMKKAQEAYDEVDRCYGSTAQMLEAAVYAAYRVDFGRS